MNLYGVVTWIFWLLLLLLNAIVLFRLVGSRLARPRTVAAQVVGKQTVERFSKYGGKRTKFAVTFQIEGKKKSFYVSELSHSGYRKGERGQLTYQGSRLIDFS